MSLAAESFVPSEPLLTGMARPGCRAIVVIPARNEEARLPGCLNALAGQVDLRGQRMPYECFEVLLLLNNCNDGSPAVAGRWREAHPEVRLHVAECRFAAEQAHVGTARHLLMDTAWCRLADQAPGGAILSTDADTRVAPDWVAQNLAALGRGADVVGGAVHLASEELLALPPQVRRCFEADGQYGLLLATLEDLLDPQEGDRSPRHVHHFGSSLAVSTDAYAVAGGMPAVSPLEDEAFIDQVRRAGLCLRHEPAVRVYTSARSQGRAVTGLAGQFRLWESLGGPAEHRVPSAAMLEHRFRMLRRLREVFAARHVGSFPLPSTWWRECFAKALVSETSCAGFLAAVYCDVLIAETFCGEREQPIATANAALSQRIEELAREPAPLCLGT